jgi:hypothetical protein
MGDLRVSMNKKGQVTIFIIVALLIIAIAALVYILSPGLSSSIGRDSNNPYDFMQTCLEDDVNNNVEIISLQGGSTEPEHTYLYDDSNIEYLCYTNEYYLPCIMQQPLLKQHIETEIKNSISGLVEQCFAAMGESFEKKGYDASLNTGELEVNISENSLAIIFEGYEFTITKGETERYDELKVELADNNLYELIMIANSILDWEVEYGDVDIATYMNYYPHIKTEKKIQDDGTAIYILTDRDTEFKFQFASRSIAWPAGYPQR